MCIRDRHYTVEQYNMEQSYELRLVVETKSVPVFKDSVEKTCTKLVLNV